MPSTYTQGSGQPKDRLRLLLGDTGATRDGGTMLWTDEELLDLIVWAEQDLFIAAALAQNGQRMYRARTDNQATQPDLSVINNNQRPDNLGDSIESLSGIKPKTTEPTGAVKSRSPLEARPDDLPPW